VRCVEPKQTHWISATSPVWRVGLGGENMAQWQLGVGQKCLLGKEKGTIKTTLAGPQPTVGHPKESAG
jgi:hypothetical protein